MLQDIKLFASQRIDKAVRETDQVLVFSPVRVMMPTAPRGCTSASFVRVAPKDDLGTGWDIVGLMTHLWVCKIAISASGEPSGASSGLSDNRPLPTRFDFDGIVFEPRRNQHRLFYADHIKFVHSVSYRFASRTSISW